MEDDPPAIDTNISDDGILVLSDSTTVTPVAESNSVVLTVNEKQSAISSDKSTSVTAPTKEYNPFANTTKKKKNLLPTVQNRGSSLSEKNQVNEKKT